MPNLAQALSLPRFSVIVPTYNDSERCLRCLWALSEQDCPRSDFEIVVVDNGSDPPLPLPSELPEDLQVTLVVELSPGSYAARNRGIREARGDILAFTDSDCLPSRTWLSTAVAVLDDKAHDVVLAGKISLFPEAVVRPNPAELYDLYFGLRQARFVQEYGFGATANLVVPKRVIANCGPFNADLKSSGDREWGHRVHACGYRIVYIEALVVRHPARNTLDALLAKVRRKAGGRHDLQAKSSKDHTSSMRGGERTRLARGSLAQLVALRREYGVIPALRVVNIMLAIVVATLSEGMRLRSGMQSRRC
ncbi:glycosyltransferase family 2 protein [Thioalkalivibrio sp. ALMg9]|uniref:glycosyltransferase n=1 Tax=Thioalkalivibrio sp. ALMg9 TaxID=1266912 RepID=UPI0009DA65F7|nr:glycosyltransferase [Thioalkalivibrio sp. ALMg9]